MRRHPLLGERQGVARFFHASSLDQLQDQPRLLRRHSQITHFSSKFHSRNLYTSLLALGCWLLAKGQEPTAKNGLYPFGAAGAEGAAGVIAPGPPGIPAGFAATSVAALMECPLKLRVKLNSPNLWP